MRFRFEGYQQGDSEFEDVTIAYWDKVLNFAAFPFVRRTQNPYRDLFPNQQGEDDFSNIAAPPPLVSFARSKKLITTPLRGENSEVIERWNTDAWDIRLRGILIDMNEHHYPSESVKKIHQLFEYNNVLEISGTQFFEKDISYIYLQSVEVLGVEGFADTVQYTLNARSTAEVNFTLVNPAT